MEDETNVAASAEVSAPEPLTVDSALERLNALDEQPEQNEPAATEQAEATPEVEEAERAEAPEAPQEEKAAPEAEPEDDFVHGNQRTRLRDGTVTTVGELKKLADQAKDYERQLSERSTREAEVEQRLTQIAQQEQFFTSTVNQAKAVLQANFPPKPDFAALERGEIDIITYNEQKAKYDHAVEKWQQLDRAQKQQAQQAEDKRQAEFKQHLAKEMDLLREKLPEARTEEGMKAFKSDLMSVAPKEYGLTPDELANFTDHRALLVLRDAIAYRKLQAEKPKALEKAKDAPPVQVQAPGRRVSPAERQAQSVNDVLSAARARGGMTLDQAAAVLNQID